MVFPNISEITHIEIIVPKNPEDASSYYLYSIKNKQQIEEIINFLEKHNNNWGYSFGPLPVYPYTASFKNNEKYLISIFFGIENSIGSSEDIATIISSEEEQELLRLLEVSQY
jgi:hypothetical protein